MKTVHRMFLRLALSLVGITAVLVLPLTSTSQTAAQQPAAQIEDYDAKARQIVAQMTLDEKISQLHGIKDQANYRVVPGLPRLGIPALTVTNGPAGVGPGGPGHEGKATALAAPISLAATWDVDAARLNGQIAGSESAALGNLLLESPDINIARTPLNGRTFESFGEDPFLAGRMAVANIQGIQGRQIIANVKHYAGNNQEQNRHKVNDVIDERTLREIYLPAFEASVKEGHVGSLMGAYNSVNGAYCCENDFLLNKVLKSEWGFTGFVTSDFGAVQSTVASAKAGLDLEMPTGIYFGKALKIAVESGEVPVSLLDDKLIRRFRTMMELGVWDQQPQLATIPPEHADVACKLATEGIVLLKNDNRLLPLKTDTIHSIALIGPFAGQAMTGGGGSSHVSPVLTVSPAEGIKKLVGENISLVFDEGKDIGQAVARAKVADIAILMLGDRQTEGKDHDISLSQDQNDLADAVFEVQPRTIVVLKTGGPILMPWIRHAPCILEAWYPGQEDGSAVAAVLFGKANPSGKLPITFPKTLADLPLRTPEQYPGVDNQAHYSEGVLVGYRWYDAKEIEPLFPFGHGLSYTTFAYKDLSVFGPDADANVTVEFTVTNTGDCAGAEVAQLYVGLPVRPDLPQPPRQLKGFCHIQLESGSFQRIKMSLDARALSYWDTASHSWKVLPGAYYISVGASSRDLRLNTTFEIK